jgi:hypothetical protein
MHNALAGAWVMDKLSVEEVCVGSDLLSCDDYDDGDDDDHRSG